MNYAGYVNGSGYPFSNRSLLIMNPQINRFIVASSGGHTDIFSMGVAGYDFNASVWHNGSFLVMVQNKKEPEYDQYNPQILCFQNGNPPASMVWEHPVITWKTGRIPLFQKGIVITHLPFKSRAFWN